MKRYITLLFFFVLVLSSSAAFAQDRRENIEAAKIAFITDRLNLTPEQAQKFWPVYNEYENKRRDLMKNYRSGYRRNLDELTDQEAKDRLEEMIDIKEKELALEKEYIARYQKVLAPKQIIQLYRADRDFTKLLLKRLDNRRANN
ncbi:Spy/CpxP family protein refolding chaperone [Pontibacter sp. MBLB2868]|uniref:Spy/CpxP family protein refolding chaperone n=1 Tax=Pontibacter sp. MBLB2868 TaxID=3451555 RepID=UPI003F74CF2C